MSKPVSESLKELLRVIALAVVSYLLTEGLGVIVSGLSLSPDQKLLTIGILTTVLRSVDKFLHELGKEGGYKTLTGGLTRF